MIYITYKYYNEFVLFLQQQQRKVYLKKIHPEFRYKLIVPKTSLSACHSPIQGPPPTLAPHC